MNGKFSRSPDALFEIFDGEAVLLSLKDGCYYGLDPVGKCLWEALASPQTVPELCTVLENEFDLDGQNVYAHVEEFLQQLVSPGLARHGLS